MRKNSLTNALIAGIAGIAGMAGNFGQMMVGDGGFRRMHADFPIGTKRRNRTNTPSNRGIIKRRKANKAARHSRVFNAQRARK